MSEGAGASSLASARAILFAPGDRLERFPKAAAAGADLVILDLEDSVAAEKKEQARANVADWLDQAGPVLVRVNGPDMPQFDADLAICDHPSVVGIVLPRAVPCAGLTRAAALRPVLALVETAKAIRTLDAIAGTPGVTRLGIGLIDLALDLGIADTKLLAPVLFDLVVASAVAGISSPVAPVTTTISDLNAVEREAAQARAAGYGAKLCIHPAQLAPVRKGLGPTDAELAWARRIVAEAEVHGGSAFALNGHMIDRPVIDRARRLIDAAN